MAPTSFGWAVIPGLSRDLSGASAAGLDPFRKGLDKDQATQNLLRIPYNQPLPAKLIRKIAERRLRDVRGRPDDAFW